MPFINVKTNEKVSNDIANEIKSELGKAITAIPGKSEGWLMVGIEDEYKLWFKGTDEPAAIVEVSVYGSPSAPAMNDLTGRITDILTDHLSVPGDRVYVSYFSTPNWGWNGSNF